MLKILWKINIYFYVKYMIRFSTVSTEQQVQKGENNKIYGTVLKPSQVNALILIFYMGLKISHEDLLTYVACGEAYRFFFRLYFSP